MTLLDQVMLDRLWANYEKRFGAPPPIATASVSEAIAFLRAELAKAKPGTRSLPGDVIAPATAENSPAFAR